MWMHGWMDVGASLQFVVDAMRDDRVIVAPDWRGFGRTGVPPGTDSYWFADYLGDLDAPARRAVAGCTGRPARPQHGRQRGDDVCRRRPERIRRLINLEGFGLPESKPDAGAQAPASVARRAEDAAAAEPYASLADVAARLIKNNPRLSSDRAPGWQRAGPSTRDDGQWHILGDPAHKRVNPSLYRKDEVLEGWKRIAAPTLWIEGDETDPGRWWGHRYPRSEFDARIALVRDVQRVQAGLVRPHAALRPARGTGRRDRALSRPHLIRRARPARRSTAECDPGEDRRAAK